jgi:dTDP-4-amino-4,6-dideoxygalactose transaminase
MAAATDIPLCVPELGERERVLVAEALASGFVSSVGPFVERFEREFARAVGAPHAVACASGTAAIHLALRALGVGRDDPVLVSDFTFIASANPVVHQGAVPAFVDSEERSWNLDPALVAQALDDLARAGTPAKAVVAVHVLGQPADLGPLVDACARHGVPLVEDAAEALGAGYAADHPHTACAGRQVGTVGRVGCFSFNGNKLITTGGGGMVTTADAELAARIRHLSTQAKLPGVAFVHDAVGYNYRLTNLAAALGLAQLERLPRFLARKRAIAARYRRLAAQIGADYHPVLPGTAPSCWLASLTVPAGRDRLVAALAQEGITTRPLWLPVSAQPAYRGSRCWGSPVAARLAATGLSLPCSSALGDEDLERVCAAVARLAQAGAGAHA